MGLSSAVIWWEEWQLRILVLMSLFIQYILFFADLVRRGPGLRRLRVLVWIAYVSSDAVAIFALATLFNRHRHTCDEEGSNLEVLWVPVLIVHLAGQPNISAYSLEDNELWKRHIVTLVSQVTVALYVFCRWWSGDKAQLAAAILLFILGIFRLAQKPWALRIASFNSCQASNMVALPRAQREYTCEDYVQAAKRCVVDTTVYTEYKYDMNRMFVDQYAPYSVRMEGLTSFLKLDYEHAYSELQKGLGKTFDGMYTRVGSIGTGLGVSSVLFLPFLFLASIVLFATSHKDGQNDKDIRVTYILLCCTTVLEFWFPLLAFTSLLFPCIYNFLNDPFEGWHDMVSQHNIMSLCVRKKKPTFLTKVATFNFLRELVNQHLYIQQVPIAYQITGTVRRHVEHGWREYICDAASYRSFSALRGQWALGMHDQLQWSLKMPFDESVLVWHVATDLCFYHPNTSLQCRQGEATRQSREISNYMFYLLLIRPEMLMLGAKSYLVTLASDKIVENSNGVLEPTEEILAREIFNLPPSARDMVSNACKLAEALMELGGDERWTVIQGVWVEMLCYSASRCRGYLHAKSLGEGGECLTYIYLLWSFMGMETLADRHHMSEPLPFHSQGRDGTSAEGDMPPV
ncbi:hypothetical protein ACQJBY_045352 [Aegilops geniculata]